jgi:hypothetical protein
VCLHGVPKKIVSDRGTGRVLGLVGLAKGVRHVSSVWFGYKGETCELCLVLATGVRPVSWWPWVTIG